MQIDGYSLDAQRTTDLESHMYKTYDKIDEAEEREFMSQLVDNVQIYEERKENGQWLKSIEFEGMDDGRKVYTGDCIK